MLIQNLVIDERSKAQWERDVVDAGDDWPDAVRSVLDYEHARLIDSKLERDGRTDVRRVRAICESLFGKFDAESLRKARAQVSVYFRLDLDAVDAITLDAFADKAEELMAVAGDRPNAGEGSNGAGVTTLADDAWLSPADIAKRFPPSNADAVSKRLARWRSTNDDGWREVTERKPREAQYLYRWGNVKHLFKASDEASGERRAK